MHNPSTDEIRREVEQLRGLIDRWHQMGELLSGVSTRLINLKQSEARIGIWKALRDLGLLMKSDRVYVFLLNNTRTQIEVTHEWCADGVIPHPFQELHGVPVTSFPWSMQQFQSGHTVQVQDPGSLPKDALPERSACEQFHIKSYINAPIFSGGYMQGWGGIDSTTENRKWDGLDILALRMIGEVVINSLTRLREEIVTTELETLRGFLPICSICKKIRDDEGFWHPVETYIKERTPAEFTHGICPVCARDHYGVDE